MNEENQKLTTFGEQKIEIKEETVQQAPVQSLEIKNLIVSSAPMRKIILGLPKDIVEYTKLNEKRILSVLWNEESINIILKESNIDLSFVPALYSSTKMFFNREEKRTDLWDEKPFTRIWEGEYEPILFTKSNLLKFLDKFSEYFDENIKTAIKNIKIKEQSKESTKMLSLDDDENIRTVIEETKTTNIPKTFKAVMPLFEEYKVELIFEAKIVKKQNRYGEKQNINVIELRCINAKEAISTVMKDIISKFPKSIPKYYGKTQMKVDKRW